MDAFCAPFRLAPYTEYRGLPRTQNILSFTVPTQSYIIAPATGDLQKGKLPMRTLLMKSLPALALLLVLTFGFTMIAMGSTCSYLYAVAVEATEYAQRACDTYGSGSNECNWAQSDAGACWNAYYEQC